MASASIDRGGAKPATGRSDAALQGNASGDDSALFSRSAMFMAGFTLALANFVVVLDMTIANVSIPHISGALGVTPQNGTYVVTSYSVAEAICVPLTGWLANRFGAVRLFLAAIAGFGIFSALCGLSSSIGLLVVFRLGQGFCGGPLMPLSQMLLLRIFPVAMRGRATALWAMTTVVAPICGPILGGWISDGWSWQWIFFINIPIVALSLFSAMILLRRVQTPTRKDPIDLVGLVILVVWVGALQVMLDLGREEDWFSSTFIQGCALVAAIGLVTFVIWELAEKHPIVDLRILRHRSVTMSMIAMSGAFGAFFASLVVIPQWLQSSMGYTATQAGYVTCMHGISAVLMAPIVARLMQTQDPRLLASGGMLWLGLASVLRTQWSTDSSFAVLAMAQLIQGFGMPFFFIPLTALSLSSLKPEETANGAGLVNFARTLSGAFAAAITTTAWSSMQIARHAQLTDRLNPDAVLSTLRTAGMSDLQARSMLDNLVSQQASAVATDHLFAISTLLFVGAAAIVWLVPKPKGPVEMQNGH